MKIDLCGKYNLTTDEVSNVPVFLPGSLDTNKIGHGDVVAKPWHPDAEERNKNMDKDAQKDPRINSRFTRKYTYEGRAFFETIFEKDVPSDKRLFLVAERSRNLSLKIDGKEIAKRSGTLSTPYVFEVTDVLKKGSRLSLCTDNSYQNLPYRDIVFSSAATDETQTNWNGIIGDFYIESKEQIFISDIIVYPHGDNLDVKVYIDGNLSEGKSYTVTIDSPDLTIQSSCDASANNPGYSFVEFKNKKIHSNYKTNIWDEYEGRLCHISAKLMCDNELISEKETNFGIRDFSYNKEGRLTLNKRVFFLRSEANCAVFPETGFPPMDKQSWLDMLNLYKSYGVNCMRFHSWCPPENAFAAADEIGMMMQPELSHWNPRDAFKSAESKAYYKEELSEILRLYANHPSFVMLTWGNELITDEEGIDYMHELILFAKETDSTRLYAWGSNNFYGAKGCDNVSDFYTSSSYKEDHIRLSGVKGIFNITYPNSKNNFSDIMSLLRKDYQKPVFGFEVGQYEVLPDMDELDDFNGITEPANYEIVRDKLNALGISRAAWKKRVEATGELSNLSYREEVESIIRTEEMSGISLLGLQDFPGQGTALVGMLNSHLKPKPFDFAKSSRFSNFFSDKVLLAYLDRYTYTFGEKLKGEIGIANYSKKDISGNIKVFLCDSNNTSGYCVASFGSDKVYSCGKLSKCGFFEIKLDKDLVKKACGTEYSDLEKDASADIAVRLNMVVSIGEAGLKNEYPIWIYPDVNPVCPKGIYETEFFDDRAVNVLEKGGKVYLTPPSTIEALPNSAKAQFSTDFWSVGTFPNQEGTMGQLIDNSHPVFKNFPTESFTNYQWWPMASQRALILPEYMDTIVTEMDSYATLRPMTQLMEVKCLKGKLLISSMGLQNLTQYREARALLSAIYTYMESSDFEPKDELSVNEVSALFEN